MRWRPVRDLLVITPTRGRPEGVRRLLDAMKATCTAQTDLVLALDDDDRSYDGQDFSGCEVVCGPRAPFAGWTNRIALDRASEYRALASFGDDHVPETLGWDSKMLAALDEKGPGIAYADDLNPRNYTTGPMVTAPVMSSSIVSALGWMCYPPLAHFYTDNVWEDLGRDAGCLYWMPEITIGHYHYTVTGQAPDATYAQAYSSWDADQKAFYEWREKHRASDSATVRKVHEGGTQ
jgi:hypothetical protein